MMAGVNDAVDNEVVQRLDDIAATLTALDLDTLNDDELHTLTIGARRGPGTRQRRRRALPRPLGHPPGVGDGPVPRAQSRLARELHCAPPTARRDLRRARSQSRLPGTTVAVAAGVLSIDHLDLLAPAETADPARFARDESLLVEHCATVSLFRHAATIIGYWRHHSDQDAPLAEPDGASWHASTTLDGTVAVTGCLDAVGGVIYTTELDRLTEQLRLADHHSGVVRSAAQRRAAAQVEMAIRSAATPPGAKRPRPLFSALIGERTLAELCELAAGHLLPTAALAPHLDTADLEVVLFGGPTTVLSVSSKRSFTGAVRRAIELRDRHCQHPSGCDIPAARCDVDHIVPWPITHRTDQFNGRLECPTHNRHPHHHDHHATPLPGTTRRTTPRRPRPHPLAPPPHHPRRPRQRQRRRRARNLTRAHASRSATRHSGRRIQPMSAPYTLSTVIAMSTRRSATIAERYSSQSGCSPAASR